MNSSLHSILTTAKPYECKADMAACEKFHTEFTEYLANTLAQQLERSVADIKWFLDRCLADPSLGLDVDYDFMYADELTDEQQELSKAYDLKEALQETRILIEGIHFPAPSRDARLDYQYFLSFIKKMSFMSCHFYGEQLFIKNGERFFSSVYSFESCVFHDSWNVTEISPPEKEVALFSKCTFLEQVTIVGENSCYSDLNEFDCIFRACVLSDVYIYGVDINTELFFFPSTASAVLNKLKIIECCFSSSLYLNNLTDCAYIEIKSTKFKKQFSLENSICADFLIKNVTFNKRTDFSGSHFGDFKLCDTKFINIANFESCHFGLDNEVVQEIALEYVTFNSFINFRYAVFNKPLNLGNTNQQQQPNFLSAIFTNQAAAGTNRETFRIIKHSFDAVGNHVEANKYFALEMQSYRRELQADKESSHCRERLLLLFNQKISSHGQNYFYAACWFVAITVIIASVLANDKYQLIPTHQAGWNWWSVTVKILNGFALGFLPLTTLYQGREHMAAFLLLATLLLSGITWHLLVAVRRHSKR